MTNATFHELTGIPPSILNKHFRLGDDSTVYWVGGIKGRTHEIVLQSVETQEIRTISAADFKRLAVAVNK